MSDEMGGPARVVSRLDAPHYVWGAGCDGWHLVRMEGLSVIEERMPPGTSEVRHKHGRSRQFFYVLDGELEIEVEDHPYRVRVGEGLEIAPGQVHQVMNKGSVDARMIVVSDPPSHGDRVEA